MKIVLTALGLLLASGLLAILAAVTGALASARTVAAGERAVVAIGAFDLAVAVAACLAFGYFTRTLPALQRWLAWLGFGVLQAIWIAAWLLLTIVMLNR